MASRAKYKRVVDLYVEGTELVTRDEGLVIWMQALNPFEQQEARDAAQAARARIVLALEEYGSDEFAKFEARFKGDGREEVIEQIAERRANMKLPRMVEKIASDPDWHETIDILERSDDILAKPPTDPEQKLLEEMNLKYMREINARLDDELTYQRRLLEGMSDEDLREEFKSLWIEMQGNDRAAGEYRLVEAWLAARVCDAVKNEDGTWDHGECDHSLRVWDEKREVRDLPESLQTQLAEVMANVNMTPIEAKDSRRPGSSSDSSPQPSAEAESTPSTPTATQDEPHGS